MSVIEDDLRSFLIADGTIASLVGTRVYPMKMPQQATLPAIVYQRVSTVRDYHMRGQGGLARAVFQVACWATTSVQSQALAEAVRARTSGYVGAMGGDTSHGIFVAGPLADHEPETDRYRALLDLTVWHAEPATA